MLETVNLSVKCDETMLSYSQVTCQSLEGVTVTGSQVTTPARVYGPVSTSSQPFINIVLLTC